MENTKLKLYYRGKRGIKETDIEISNVIRDAKFHYIVTSSSLGMCRSIEDAIQKAAKDLHTLGCQYVLVKGGHLSDDATDVLYDGKEFYLLNAKRLVSINTHGTGCTLSSAIAANLAKGYPVKQAVEEAKAYITEAIGFGFPLGKGVGPVHHFYKLYKDAGVEQ